MEKKCLALERLGAIRHFVLDMDGTIYLGNRLLPATVSFLELLGSLGIGRSFITNNSSLSAARYVEKLLALGIAACTDDIFTSSHATLEYLARHHPEVRRLFVLGTSDLREEIAATGLEIAEQAGSHDQQREPDAVVVGFDTSLTYQRLCQAAYWISRGKLYLATHPDRVCPADGPVVLPDCGALCACLEQATGRQPDAVLGKPDPRMIEGVLQRYQLGSSQIAVVGDRLYTDIEMARQSGALGVLVLTGETDRQTAAAATPGADLVVNDLAELGQLLQNRIGFARGL